MNNDRFYFILFYFIDHGSLRLRHNISYGIPIRIKKDPICGSLIEPNSCIAEKWFFIINQIWFNGLDGELLDFK